MNQRKRVLSGIQPSGEAHLGNYLGAIQRWSEMIDEYDCFYCIVDLHAITQDYDTREMPRRIFDLAVSLIASGLDPERCTLFVQSHVPQHTELAWLLNTVTPIGDLQRMTQFKEKSAGQESVNAGLLNYPVLQAADILIYRADLVPVGEDQRQHLEMTREVARRWNARFGDYFPVPDALIGAGRRVLGTDGVTKMSKSRDNTIPLLGSDERTWEAVRGAVTDPARVRKNDPGNPNVCNIFALHDFFTDPSDRADIEIRCQTATIGCVDCKRALSENLSARLAPIRARAAELEATPERVVEILAAGAEVAARETDETMTAVCERMGLGRAALAAGVGGVDRSA